MKVFITGATGFVGSYLTDFLLSRGWPVSGTTYPKKPEECPAAKGKDIVFLDITSEKEVFEAFQRFQPEGVFHLAAVSNVSYSWRNRKKTLETNIIGTLNVFEAARKYSPHARILYVSSSDVYGLEEGRDSLLREEFSTGVVSPYAFTKLSGELLSKFYARIEDLDIVVARSFPHTGPGQSPDFVCSDWAYQVARIEKGLAEPVIHVGNLDVRRDYSDVRDVVKAYVSLIEKGRKGEVYNVCSGRAQALRDILHILLSYSERSIEVQVDKKKLRKADIPLLRGDRTKIGEETSWKPEIPLRQTLSDLLNYWRNERDV